MGISSPRRVNSQNRPAGRPRRTPRLLFDRLEDRLALAASPAFSINDVSLIEGNAGTIGATFTVSLSKASNPPVSVNYATSAGTAVAGSDFDAASGTLTFAKGQTSRTITVPVRGDTLDEAAETFFVNLSAPSPKTTIGKGRGVGTIFDNDPPPSIAIGDATTTESETGTVVATFNVALSAPSGQVVTVAVSTADGTATGGPDYGVLSRTITFAPGQTSQTIVIPIGRDLLDEDDETFFVNLSDPTNADIADAQGTGTIVDNDAMPSIIISDTAISEGQSGTESAYLTFYVALSAPSGRPVTVAYSTADGTATVGSDFVATTGTLTFSPGQTSLTVAVPLLDDTLDEENEIFFLTLSDPSNAVIADAQGFGRIDDDDTPPALSIDSSSIAEGNTGSQGLTFTVTLSAPSGRPVTVSYTTATNGSATADTDFTTTSGTLTFLPGTTAQTITVPIVGDTIVEQHEIFFVRLSAPVNASILAAQGTGTILNDDVAPTTALSINDATVTEGNTGATNAILTVTLSAPSNQQVMVSYDTFNYTATVGTDYTSTSGTLTFLPGQTSQTISVPILGDTADDGDNESFFVRLRLPVNAIIADGQGVVTIVDDDPTPSLSISDATVTEGNTGATNAILTVTLSAPSDRFLGINYATFNNSALPGSDYTPISGSFTFLPGQTTQTISVPILGDATDEPDETFIVRLGTPQNVSIADGEGVVTIIDDDPSPSLTISDATVTEGNTGATNAFFTVRLSAPSVQAVTVAYDTFDNTAAAGSDYTSTTGSLTFLPGQTSKIISVPVLGEPTVEPNEFYFVRLKTPVNATIADGEGIGTIIDNDPSLSLTVSSTTVTEGNTGVTNAIFTVTLSAPGSQVVTVSYDTVDKSAVAGSDYTSTTGSLTFLPGQTTQTISVPILDDTTDEREESFFVHLRNPVNAAIAGGGAPGVIVDNDPEPSISINNPGTFEGNTGATSASFTVTLSAASEQVVTVAYTTADGSATAGSDYESTSGILTFLPGQTSQSIDVPILGDSTPEPDESFFVHLGTALNATIDAGEGVVTIVDDDPTPNLSFTIEDASIVEGDSDTSFLVFRVVLSGPSNSLEWAVLTTADGTAKASEGDYTPQLSDYGITFLAGVTEQTISIPILGDTSVESDEVFYVNLIRASRTIADNQAEGTIINDDTSEF